MVTLNWEHFPRIAQHGHAQRWLVIQVNLQLAPNTIEAYGRNLEDFLSFCERAVIDPNQATREHIALYVREMASRPNPAGGKGLANATMQQHLTALRLYYDYLIEEQVREQNPVGRGRYTPGKAFAGARDRGIIPHYRQQPWIPTDAQWQAILEAARPEPLRNRVMLALAYDGALRREELCALATGDIDPAHRLLHIRAETTKGRRARVVPYSRVAGTLYATYLEHRRTISRLRGALFVSESRRNYGQAISIWTWSKVIGGIAKRAQLPQFTTHTPRHLCLTDLARANWDLHEIAQFAGHRSVQTTLLYIHLSGRELAEKFEQSMATLHVKRLEVIAELLQ